MYESSRMHRSSLEGRGDVPANDSSEGRLKARARGRSKGGVQPAREGCAAMAARRSDARSFASFHPIRGLSSRRAAGLPPSSATRFYC